MKNRFTLITSTAIILTTVLSARGVTVFQTENIIIPDNDPNGVSSSITLNAPFQSISSVQVSLNIAGGYNGDLYAYLRNSQGGFAVLLNRVGSTAANEFGSPDSGFTVTFDDTAPSGDIHLASAGGGVLSGVWQPDGRDASPYSVTDTTPRNTSLGSFLGMNPNTTWSLFIADLSASGEATLVSWGLNVSENLTPVPEPSTLVAGLLTAGLLLFSLKPKKRTAQ